MAVPQVTATFDCAGSSLTFYFSSERQIHPIYSQTTVLGHEHRRRHLQMPSLTIASSGSEAVMLVCLRRSAEKSAGGVFHWGMATAHQHLAERNADPRRNLPVPVWMRFSIGPRPPARRTARKLAFALTHLPWGSVWASKHSPLQIRKSFTWHRNQNEGELFQKAQRLNGKVKPSSRLSFIREFREQQPSSFSTISG